MSDTNSNTSANAVADDQGYTPEPTTTAADASARQKAEAEMRSRNLRATFGSGMGRLSLIAIGVVVVVFIVLGIAGLRSAPVAVTTAQVDAPTSPPNRVSTNTVTPEEAARRATQSQQEASAAQDTGKSYQPGFDYNIGSTDKATPAPGAAKFSGFETRDEETSRAQGPSGSARTMQAQAAPTATTPQQAQQQAEQTRKEQELQRASERLATEQKTAEGDRDKYVESVSQEVVKQIGGMFASQGNDSLNNVGSYSQTTYYTAPKSTDASARNLATAQRLASRRALIKAGNTMFATLDSEVNTDDGRTVMATIRSGQWKGSKLIGQIEQAYSNVSLNFTLLAPQDDRSTLRIRAVALREQDAKLGMAEKIDHHTLSRYSALAAAALMQGAGRVYQQPIGTTAITNSGIVTTTQPPRESQVVGSAIGEMGIALGAEIRRRGFNQPSTYSTPAETGFVLYFLEDVLPPSNAEDAQQQPQQQAQQQVLLPQAALGGQPAIPAGMYPPGAQGTQGPGGFNQGYGGAAYGTTPYGYGVSPYQGMGNDNRYRGPLNGNY